MVFGQLVFVQSAFVHLLCIGGARFVGLCTVVFVYNVVGFRTVCVCTFCVFILSAPTVGFFYSCFFVKLVLVQFVIV